MSRSCVSILHLDGAICRGKPSTINVRGQGFTRATILNNASSVKCKVTGLKTNLTKIIPGVLVDSNNIRCDLPQLPGDETEVSISSTEITLNGIAYTNSGLTVPVSDCLNAPINAAAVAAGVIVGVLVLLFLLWWLWPLLCGVTAAVAAPTIIAAPLLATGKTADGKWAKVDTSNYIWAKDGGAARPVCIYSFYSNLFFSIMPPFYFFEGTNVIIFSLFLDAC